MPNYEIEAFSVDIDYNEKKVHGNNILMLLCWYLLRIDTVCKYMYIVHVLWMGCLCTFDNSCCLKL